MESLYDHMQMADSSNAFNPWVPGAHMMDEPCVRLPNGTCVSRVPNRVGRPTQYTRNPPPEESEYMQVLRDPDVRGIGMRSDRQPDRHKTVGASGSDVARGDGMLLPSAADMPIVRKIAMFDTRFRDPTITPDATRVQFTLGDPITSVSRIAVISARVPIVLTGKLLFCRQTCAFFLYHQT
jgi:hypothetical protein